MNVGRTLYRRRKELNMSQEEIADFLGYSKSAYQKWETEKNEPPASVLEDLSKKLKIPIERFFSNSYEGERDDR